MRVAAAILIFQNTRDRLAAQAGRCKTSPDSSINSMTSPADLHFLMAAVIALAPATVQELTLGGATLVILLGMWLCWGAPRYRMSIEESMKDGKMTARDADHRIRRSQWMGPCVTIIGVGLLTFAVTR